MSLSSVKSETALRSRLFSSSRSFRRFTCSLFRPPHCGHPRHRLAVRADVLAGRLRGVHCALRPLLHLKLVCPARLGLDHEGHRVCTPVGVSSIRASTIRAMAIMTNAVETNRILGSSLKLIYCTSFSHEL